MNQTLSDYYRVPDNVLDCTITTADGVSENSGFFKFGAGSICYGHCQSGVSADVVNLGSFDASKHVHRNGASIQLPFNFTEVIENLRLERYRLSMAPGKETFATRQSVRKLYYLIRGLLPVRARRHLQKYYFRDWRRLPFPAWPVDSTVDTLHEEILGLLMETSGVKKVPFIWFWPEGATNCLIMTHDVETSAGRDFTSKLIDLDESFGIRASFQVIPEKRYEVPDEYVHEIRGRGCEFNIHDLNHDGHLYREWTEFVRRAERINGYIHRYNTQGFRSGAMYRIQDWYQAFEFSYDMSVPNVAHLEPMRGGCCTVMPYFVGKIVELPLTAAQDYSLFHILNDYSIELWKQQLALLRARNGLMSFIAHPDYLIERRARNVYETLLAYLQEMIARERVWATLPGELNRWWRARSRMSLIQENGHWKVEGAGKESARIAYASIEGGRLTYEVCGIGQQ